MANDVLTTHTPNAGRAIWNANDDLLEDAITTDAANLVTHKASADHDGRYYTEGEADTLLAATVKLTGAQTVAGVKTFTDDPIVKKVSPSIELQHSDASKLVRLGGVYTPETQLQLQAWVAGAWRTLLNYLEGSGYVDFPNDDLYSKSKKLATEEYVQARLRSGSRVLTGQTASLALGAGAAYTQINGVDQLLAVPVGTEITWVNAYSEGGAIKTIGSAVNVANEPAIKIRVTASANSGATAIVSIHRVNGDSLASVQGGQGMNGIFAVSLTL
jgi:hypothetical protein